MKRMLPMHYIFWKLTKHGSNVKTQCVQSKKNTINNNNLGDESFDSMLLISFSKVHRGSATCAEGSIDRINSCKSIENFRMRAKQKMTFRDALHKINNITRNTIKNV